MEAGPIQDHGIIGDGRSAALVSRTGAINWLCWPRFDSPSLFAALLDPERGGRWCITPQDVVRASRAYVPQTNVLVSRFETRGGAVQLTDFLTAASEEEKRRALVPEHELLRCVECTRGEVLVDVLYEPRPDYGRKHVPLRDRGTLGLRLEIGQRLFVLRSTAPLQVEDTVARARIRLRAGEKHWFSLSSDTEAPAVLPSLDEAPARLESSLRWWRTWAGRVRYDGPYRDEVVRSALVLKLMSYAPSGAIVAAPTTSLPERVGGSLNWDYRFCWVRDAAFTVCALMGLGFDNEARAFVSWLLHTTRLTRPELRVLYDVYGRLPRDEEVLHHLEGYRASRPVRIRNAAADQLQLDSYGEVIDATYHLVSREGTLDRETQEMFTDFGTYVCHHWPEPDQGIWEPRDAPQLHTHSRALCWTALDRLLKLHEMGLLHRLPAERFAMNRAWLREEIETRGWNPQLESYTQVLGGDTLDASLLQLGWYGYAPAHTPRMQRTGRRILERLGAGPALLLRYEQSRLDDEGAFGICSFWMAEHLARGGGSFRLAEAWFERLLGYANDLGLFAEEIDPRSGEPLGNFPQAFTHVGLITAAMSLEERRLAEGAAPRAAAQAVREEALR